MRNSELFKEELDLIQNEHIREITRRTLDNAPEYIQTIPASSSGKYHPTYSLGEGGLARHIKACVGIARCMLENENVLNDEYEQFLDIEKDIIYSSLILHDCMKCGDNGELKTKFEHPNIASELFERVYNEYLDYIDNNKDLTVDEYNELGWIVWDISNCIKSHMGQWSTNKHSKVILETPEYDLERFVHICDYLASRRFIEFNFDKYKEQYNGQQ